MNVQVHCEHCDKALYPVSNNVSATAASTPDDFVVLNQPTIGPRIEGAVFCDWRCVELWARRKRTEAVLVDAHAAGHAALDVEGPDYCNGAQLLDSERPGGKVVD